MNALVIYDSFFGNTEKIAQAIATGVGNTNCTIMQVAQVTAKDLNKTELLIVGSPTRGFRPTPAITKFINNIPNKGLDKIKVTAFDTRIAMEDVDSKILPPLVKMFGYAAKPIADKLVKKAGVLSVPPEGFYVKDSEGPLRDGELARAAEWGRKIVESIAN